MWVPRAMYSLRMSFWTVPPIAVPRNPLFLRHCQVHGQEDRRRRVDRHRGRDPAERNAVEQRPHVVDAVDGDADPSDLAAGRRGVRVVADLGGQVEGDGEAGRPLVEQVTVAAVRLPGAGVAGVLAHRPQPLAVHVPVEAPGEGERAGRRGAAGVVAGVVRGEEGGQFDVRTRGAGAHGGRAYRRPASRPRTGRRSGGRGVPNPQDPAASPQLLRSCRRVCISR